MRYIIIDRNSGFVFGDTADRWWRMDEAHPAGPLEATKSLDHALMVDTSEMHYAITDKYDAKVTYDIYSAEDCFPVVRDGQDQSVIDLVCKRCAFTASVARY
tara:strand:- start:5407 stop:5712 length:306 start_codon:yes stop_codon:yes gene_type:complete